MRLPSGPQYHTHAHTHTHTHTHTHNQTCTQLNTRATRPPPFSTHARTRADHEHQPCGPQRLFAVKPPWRSGSRVCVHVYLYSMYKCTMMTLAVHWTLYNITKGTICTCTKVQYVQKVHCTKGTIMTLAVHWTLYNGTTQCNVQSTNQT